MDFAPREHGDRDRGPNQKPVHRMFQHLKVDDVHLLSISGSRLDGLHRHISKKQAECRHDRDADKVRDVDGNDVRIAHGTGSLLYRYNVVMLHQPCILRADMQALNRLNRPGAYSPLGVKSVENDIKFRNRLQKNQFIIRHIPIIRVIFWKARNIRAGNKLVDAFDVVGSL